MMFVRGMCDLLYRSYSSFTLPLLGPIIPPPFSFWAIFVHLVMYPCLGFIIGRGDSSQCDHDSRYRERPRSSPAAGSLFSRSRASRFLWQYCTMVRQAALHTNPRSSLVLQPRGMLGFPLERRGRRGWCCLRERLIV